MSSAICNFPMFQLCGLVTVDATPGDKVLERTRARYSTLGPDRLYAHSSQAAAVSRCLSSNGESSIVGHGESGAIATGSGIVTTDPAKRISVGNIGNWSPSTMTELTLLGCNTGAGTSGAELLYAIARATGVSVRAPVGHVYIGRGCPDFYLEPGTGWQAATPTAQPPALFDPLPAEFFPQHLRLMSVDDRFVEVKIVDVTRVRLLRAPAVLAAPGFPEASGPIREWEGDGTRAPIDRVSFDDPLLRGEPAAIETGGLELEYRSDTARHMLQRRQFRIYNDNRLQDMTFPEVLYRANVTEIRNL